MNPRCLLIAVLIVGVTFYLYKKGLLPKLPKIGGSE